MVPVAFAKRTSAPRIHVEWETKQGERIQAVGLADERPRPGECAMRLSFGEVKSGQMEAIERAKTTAGSARCGRLRIGAVERGCSISMH